MVETLMFVLIALSFCIVSIALALHFGVGAYLEWQEQQVAIKYGLRIISERKAKQEDEDDDPFD